MSQPPPDVIVVQETTRTVEVDISPPPVVELVAATGPPGPAGQWEQLTQAEYDQLDPPDPETLYVIIG